MAGLRGRTERREQQQCGDEALYRHEDALGARATNAASR
jgi:hypothetical protein